MIMILYVNYNICYRTSLGERLLKESHSTVVTGVGGNMEMKFSMRGDKKKTDVMKKNIKHYQERKQFVRRTGFLQTKKMPKRL